MTDHTVPPIGMRMVKTAAAVLICLLVSMAVDREDMRIYSSIAALLCVQPYAEDTKRMAIQRIVGTAIGSVFGIATLLLEMALDIQGTLVGYIVIAAVTVPNLWIAVVLKSSNAAALSGIVFQLFPRQIGMLFVSDSPLYLDCAQHCFRLYMAAFFLYGLHLATASFFQGIGRPVPSLAIPLARQGVFLIPLAILLSGRFGLDGALLAAPISDMLTFLLSLLLVRREFAVWRQRDWIET